MRWLTTFLNCWRIELLFNCYPHSKAHKYNAIRQAEMYHWYLIYFLPQKLAQVQKFAALVVALQNDDRKFTAQWRKTTFLFPISIFETSVYNRARNRNLLAAQNFFSAVQMVSEVGSIWNMILYKNICSAYDLYPFHRK